MSDGPLLRKVDCLALRVADLDDGLAFYERLGHELLWRTATGVGLRLPDSEAELVLQTERPGPETDLTVENVGQAIERFVAAGGRVVVAPFDITIGRCAVVVDPWDNHLVLLDNSKRRHPGPGCGDPVRAFPCNDDRCSRAPASVRPRSERSQFVEA